MSFPRYEKYKDSGVEWLGEVSEHWDVRPLKKLGRLTTGLTPPTENRDNYEEESQFPWVRPEDICESGQPSRASKFLSEAGWELLRRAEPNATLICCIGTIGKIDFTDIPITTNQQITSVNFVRSSRFFYYAAYAAKSEMLCEATGNVIRILNSERLGSILLAVAPADEAEKISTFLDHETAKIDALVEEQKRLIELLTEKRQAVI